jgi:hypothetical protein
VQKCALGLSNWQFPGGSEENHENPTMSDQDFNLGSLKYEEVLTTLLQCLVTSLTEYKYIFPDFPVLNKSTLCHLTINLHESGSINDMNQSGVNVCCERQGHFNFQCLS